MPEPITYESPKLTRIGSNLKNGDYLAYKDGTAFVCIDIVESMLEEEFPEATEYYIEASTKQWSDRSGYGIWVCDGQFFWHWGRTRKNQKDRVFYAVMNALDNSGIPKNRPVRIYFRLTYYE